ncbi:MAG: hypothetical protein AB7O97_19930 [Planctomycetota bacterium]
MAARRIGVPSFVSLVFVAACGTAPPPTGWWLEAGRTDGELSAAFRAAVAPQDAAHRGDPELATWSPGDRLVFGLEAFAGDALLHRWQIELQVLGTAGAEPPVRTLTMTAVLTKDGVASHHRAKLPARPQRLRATVSELGGETLFTGESEVPDALFQLGIHDHLERLLDGKVIDAPFGGDGSAESPFLRPPQDDAWTFAVLLRLFDTFQGNDAMLAVLRELADTPGLFDVVSMAVTRRYTLVTDAQQPLSLPVPAWLPFAPPSGRALGLPFHIRIGSSAVLAATATFVPTRGALSLSAGLVALVGHRPSDPTRRFVLRLLAAQRGAS